ncbi:MAG TPA: RNA polymerase sigma factor [Bacteroidales bacterium]|nr:RNA polymerase sigma factor [Bacteroidales bacterium]
MHIEDREILNLLGNYDTRDKGFLLLVNKYQRRLYHHIRRLLVSHDDTDDALQNTFLKAWNGIERFREESQLFTWLYRIATNEALSILKRNKRWKEIAIENLPHAGPATDPDPGTLSGDEISMKLISAIKQLPPKQQAVFNLRYFDELKYEEISGILGTSVGALKASYHHAIKKIEKFLDID